MKLIAVPLAVLIAASVMSAQTPTPAKPADPKVAPAKTVDPKAAKTPAKKEPEKEPVIPGVLIPRANGTFLGLEVVNGQFKLSFYDKKKKIMTPDVTRVNARWPNKRSATTGDFRTVLNLSGNALVGSRPVIPPLVFNVYLTLLQGDGDAAVAVENYTVQMR